VFDDLIFVKQTYFGMHPFCIAEAFAVHQFTFLPFSTEVFWVEIQFVFPPPWVERKRKKNILACIRAASALGPRFRPRRASKRSFELARRHSLVSVELYARAFFPFSTVPQLVSLLLVARFL
jgi:hypothetical protein